MRVLYFGDPRGALALLERGATLVGVVHGRRGGPGWSKLLPRLAGVPRWTRPDLDAVLGPLADTRPDLIVSGFYPRRIPASVLALAPGINVHPSDLPRWRGPDPITWALRAGDERTAICVHWLTEGVDEGDVLHRVPVLIEARDTGARLADRLEAQCAEVVADVALRLLRGEKLAPQPQMGEVTWAPLVHPDEWEIDWSRPAVEIDRFVRAASPDPGAFTGIGEELLVILGGRPLSADQFEALVPGTPFVRSGHAFIRCGEDAYRLDRVRLGQRTLNGRQLAELLV
ncbi:MAG: hypothetical protein KC620_05960 [Myxococcales bacterium]|nr:hypothetical protein [Myxococcales bacterium]